ncbi:hypothetical protein NFI96_008151 [Prochilodus magdalenae]|nr:hypothetical protein NFI96_008151 [Prochilodus magdalenae]
MSNIPEALVYTFENLGQEDLKTFLWHLISGVERFTPIPKALLENADRHDTVDRIVQRYGHSGAVEITQAILKKMNQNQLSDQLRSILKDGEKCEEIAGKNTLASPTAAQAEDSGVSTLNAEDLQHCIQLMSKLRQLYESILIGNSQTGHTKFLEDIYTDLIIVQNESGGVIQEHEVMEMSSVRPGASDGPRQQKEIPTYLTGMYVSFLLQQKTLITKEYSEQTKLLIAEHVILKLGELAFHNLESGALIFSMKMILENVALMSK